MANTTAPKCPRCGVEAMRDSAGYTCLNPYCRDKGKRVQGLPDNFCPECKADWGEVFDCLASLPMTPDRVIGEAIVANCRLCQEYFSEMPTRVVLEAERQRRQMAAIKKALG